MPQFATLKQASKQGITAPFLRLAATRRLKLNTVFVMDNRRILMGLVYPVRFGGFYHIKIKSQGGNLNETENRKKAAELFAHAGDGRWACAGNGADGGGGDNTIRRLSC